MFCLKDSMLACKTFIQLIEDERMIETEITITNAVCNQ